MGLYNKAYLQVTEEGPQEVDSHGVTAVSELGTGRKEGRTEDPRQGETTNQRQPTLYLDNERHRRPSTLISSEGEGRPDWSLHKTE